jgi:DNA-binding Xre family transcriptional regulator
MSAVGTVIRRQALKGNSAVSMRFRVALARNMRFAMGRIGLSWTELADAVGMTRERVQHMSTGEACPSALELTLIGQQLGVSLDELTKGCVE